MAFEYKNGPLRYVILNGANLKGYHHQRPRQGSLGQIRLTFETVDPPGSKSDPDGSSISSSLGLHIQLGGEHDYQGALFLTDLLWADLDEPRHTDPLDPVAAFNVSAKDGEEAAFAAYLPMQLMRRFNIAEPWKIRAALKTASDGKVHFIAGSMAGVSEGFGKDFVREVFIKEAPEQGADRIPPNITLSGTRLLKLLVGSDFTDPGVIANDNVDGDLTDQIKVSGDQVDTSVAGTYKIAYNVSDSSGNKAREAIRTVIVEVPDPSTLDRIRPVIFLHGRSDLELLVGQPFVEPGYKANDNVDGNIADAVIVDGADFDSNVIGTYTITYNVSDIAGNAAKQKLRTVTVAEPPKDTTPPVIHLKGRSPFKIFMGAVFIDPGFTALDDFDGDITEKVVVSGDDFDSNVRGAYAIKYTVSDTAGNARQIVRTVQVIDPSGPSLLTGHGDSPPNLNADTRDNQIDTTAPVITLNGDGIVKLSVGEEYTDAGATATDDTDGDLTAKIAATGAEVDTSVAGTYHVKYNVSDAAGNVASEVVRTVIVEDGHEPEPDTTAPVITLLGPASLKIQIGEEYIDAGATASDDTDGDVTDKISVTGDDFDSNIAGTYTVKYNVSDAAGNAASEVTRAVTVEEDQEPSKPNVTIASVTASDGKITVTLDAPVGSYDHWHVSLDQSLSTSGAAGGVMVSDGLTHTFEEVGSGSHTVYVGLVDAAHELVSDIVTVHVYVPKTDGPQVALTFGSAFAGEDGSIFASSDGKGLDASNKGVLSLGFFGTGFDVSEAGKDVDSILQNFVPLYSSNFNGVAAPGSLLQEVLWLPTG